MKLELKHLAHYLPYGLKVQYHELDDNGMEEGGVTKLSGLYYEDDIATFSDCMDYYFDDENDVTIKPILRPLSDLTKEIEHNGEKFVPIDWFENKYYTLDLHKQCKRLLEEDGENWIYQSDYMIVGQLFEWYFDVFGLIPQNLAIDINTLK